MSQESKNPYLSRWIEILYYMGCGCAVLALISVKKMKCSQDSFFGFLENCRISEADTVINFAIFSVILFAIYAVMKEIASQKYNKDLEDAHTQFLEQALTEKSQGVLFYYPSKQKYESLSLIENENPLQAFQDIETAYNEAYFKICCVNTFLGEEQEKFQQYKEELSKKFMNTINSNYNLKNLIYKTANSRISAEISYEIPKTITLDHLEDKIQKIHRTLNSNLMHIANNVIRNYNHGGSLNNTQRIELAVVATAISYALKHVREKKAIQQARNDLIKEAPKLHEFMTSIEASILAMEKCYKEMVTQKSFFVKTEELFFSKLASNDEEGIMKYGNTLLTFTESSSEKFVRKYLFFLQKPVVELKNAPKY